MAPNIAAELNTGEPMPAGGKEGRRGEKRERRTDSKATSAAGKRPGVAPAAWPLPPALVAERRLAADALGISARSERLSCSYHLVGRSGYEPLALSCDMAADYSAVCLAIALKFDLVHPVIDSTAISNGHISASGSDRAPDAPNQQIRRSSGWGAAVGRNSRAQSQGSGT